MYTALLRYLCTMKTLVIFFFVCISFCQIKAQDLNSLERPTDTTKVIDKQYREDQFYISVTYNLLGNKPGGVAQSGFSTGYHLGFIRDMPINAKRNLAVGFGLGISSNSYNQTLLISEVDNDFIYTILNDNEVEYSKNKFTTYLLELPIEFRWRTSTPEDYDFWRIYAGLKLGYIVYNSSKFNSIEGDIQVSRIDDFNELQYGLTLSAGYSNISFHFYYALNSIFSDAVVNDESIDMNSIRIGLMFYIL